MKNEVWKDIKGYEGLYQVSSFGRVRSLTRKLINKKGVEYTVYSRYLSAGINQGYKQVVLCKEGKRKTCRLGRLVAEAFIPNPLNLPQVNHINEIKTDNRAINLEWCSSKYNCNYGSHIENIQKNRNIQSFIKNKSKAIIQLTLDGEYVKQYSSIKEAAEDTELTNISNALSGRYYQSGGYCWVYKDEYERYFR